MIIRDMFVPVFANVGFEAQLDAASQLARQFNSHINVVFTRPDPATAAAAVPEMVVAGGVMLEAIEIEGKAAQAKAHVKFEAWRVANDLVAADDEDCVQIVGASWYERVGLLEKAIIEIGRVSDLIIINYPDPYEPITDRAFAAAVFETGCPTLLVPKTLDGDFTRHIIIAWNGSLEAARAIDRAMPLLCKAERASIFTAPKAERDAGDLGLIRHLRWHGIRADHLSPEADPGAVGAALIDTAANENASMIVMGAYTHSRLRETLLGGVTRHVIKAAAIPVLMMH
jgi:nucleotide-binding universal stress UspA family protein